MTELVKKETVTDLVGKYNATIESMKRLFKELAGANKSFQAFREIFHFYVGRSGHGHHECDMDLVATVLKAEAWEGIIRKTQMFEAMTERRRAEIEKQIQEDKMPEITVENVYSILNSLYSKSNYLLTESIKEAFEILRPRHSKHKTNSEFDVPPKVVVTNWMERIKYSGSVKLGYYCRGQIQSVCNAFSLMDGKGVSKYPCNLETAITGAIDKNLDTCETEYFKCKWYLAGTLHLEFKRLDLLAKLNQIGGGSRLYK